MTYLFVVLKILGLKPSCVGLRTIRHKVVLAVEQLDVEASEARPVSDYSEKLPDTASVQAWNLNSLKGKQEDDKAMLVKPGSEATLT